MLTLVSVLILLVGGLHCVPQTLQVGVLLFIFNHTSCAGAAAQLHGTGVFGSACSSWAEAPLRRSATNLAAEAGQGGGSSANCYVSQGQAELKKTSPCSLYTRVP